MLHDQLVQKLQRINNMAHKEHSAVFIQNLRSDLQVRDLKPLILSLFKSTLRVNINKRNITIITSTGNCFAHVDVPSEDDIECILQRLSTIESQRKLGFDFTKIVPPGQMLDIQRFKLADKEQAIERFPDISERQIVDIGNNASKVYVFGEKLGNETRNTEFKKAGGRYMETEMPKDVQKYLCGFLNSGVRGTLMFGVLDDGTVEGVKCSHDQEDRYRLGIDCAIKEIEPSLFPQHYKVEFTPVVEKTRNRRANCKVIKVTVEVPSGQLKIYRAKDRVFMRRDGSLQVITKWSDIQELITLQHRDIVNQQYEKFQMQLERKERTIETLVKTIQQRYSQQYCATQRPEFNYNGSYMLKDYRLECGQRYLKEIRSFLSDKPTEVHLVNEDYSAVDNTFFDSKLEMKKIVEVASQQPHWGEQIPTRWFPLAQQLMTLKDAGQKVVSHSTVEELNKDGALRIEESAELDLFLRYLHETGTVIYFSIEVLRDNILLDPKWMIDAIKLLIKAQPNLPNSPADNDSESNSPADCDITQKWSDFKNKGILTVELVDAIWTKENHPDLHKHKNHILMIMEQLNILARPRSFNEMGEKVEEYFLTPYMLQESHREFVSIEQDIRLVSTPVLCWVFKGKFLPSPVFHRLIAACITRWPVSKKRDTSEYLIFCGCCMFNLDLFHRLTLYCRNHIVFARIARLVIDEVKTPETRLCTRVRKFITMNLSKLTSCLGQNLPYELRTQWPPSHGDSEDNKAGLSPPFEIWFTEESHDPEASITPEHMNYDRLGVALITVCGNALRKILQSNFPVPYADIYQVILANRLKLTQRPGHPIMFLFQDPLGNLTQRPGRQLLNRDQIMLLFPNPNGDEVGTLDQFDISLLYILIRNVSTVPEPITGWNMDPCDQPRDTSLGASVERIRSYRNHITGHREDGRISREGLEDYWNKFEAVIRDIEAILGEQVCSQELEKQKKQVISIYEAC